MTTAFAELETLRDVAQRLDASGFAYMLTGSMAMNYYAEPRMTRDLDIVVAINQDDIVRATAAFADVYYVDSDLIHRAIEHASIANIVHLGTLVKVDLIPLQADAWSQEAFRRRRRVNLGEFSAELISLEDLILAKLRAMAESGSDTQRRDIINLLAAVNLDHGYLERWAKSLGVAKLLKSLLS